MLPSSLRPNDLLHDAPPYTFSVRQLSTPKKARTVLLLSSTACKLLSGKQLIRTERHGQKLLQCHDRVLAQLVVHQYRRVGLRNGSVKSMHRMQNPSYFLTSQNSRMNCLHMPQGLAGGEMSVATAMARKSPALAPW